MSAPSPIAANLLEAAAAAAGRELSLTERYQLLQPLLGEKTCRALGIYPLPPNFRLSVVIPVFNEVRTIETVLTRVRDCGLPCELIVVDDGSTDGTRNLLSRLREAAQGNSDLKILLHDVNRGKGAALRTGMAAATGDAVIIQDGDLEYEPQDFTALVQPLVEGEADVVYGSRFSGRNGPVLSLWHTWANQFISLLTSLRAGRRFSDVETCYKLIRRETLARILPNLREERFGIEIELTLRLAALPDVRFHERAVHYRGRGYVDGKKITWQDGVWALWCIVKY